MNVIHGIPIEERHLAQAREGLSESEFNAAWAEGRAMTMEQAIEFALQENNQ